MMVVMGCTSSLVSSEGKRRVCFTNGSGGQVNVRLKDPENPSVTIVPILGGDSRVVAVPLGYMVHVSSGRRCTPIFLEGEKDQTVTIDGTNEGDFLYAVSLNLDPSKV